MTHQTRKLILCDGGKGGVGKSTMTRTLLQYCADHSIPVTPMDCDRLNPDVMRIYKAKGCLRAVFSEGEEYEDAANSLFNEALHGTVIVNMPAQILSAVKKWIENNDIFTLAAESNLQIYIFFVSDGGYDSLKILKHSLKYFGGNVQFLLVRNYGKCSEWSHLDSDSDLQALMNQYQVKTSDLPKFNGISTRNLIDELSLTYGAAREAEALGGIGRQRVKTYLKAAYPQIASTGVFGNGDGHGQDDG